MIWLAVYGICAFAAAVVISTVQHSNDSDKEPTWCLLGLAWPLIVAVGLLFGIAWIPWIVGKFIAKWLGKAAP